MLEGASPRLERTLAVADRVREVLREHGVDSAIIGAMALAIYGYPRATEDFDLGTHVDPFQTLPAVAAVLQEEGYRVELRQPDADDPVGGVVDITGDDFDLIQIVNFLNPLGHPNGLAAEAIRSAIPASGTQFRAVDLPHLVALKLQAGAPTDVADVRELLGRNPEADLSAIRDVCRRFELGGALEKILAP